MNKSNYVGNNKLLITSLLSDNQEIEKSLIEKIKRVKKEQEKKFNDINSLLDIIEKINEIKSSKEESKNNAKLNHDENKNIKEKYVDKTVNNENGNDYIIEKNSSFEFCEGESFH